MTDWLETLLEDEEGEETPALDFLAMAVARRSRESGKGTAPPEGAVSFGEGRAGEVRSSPPEEGEERKAGPILPEEETGDGGLPGAGLRPGRPEGKRAGEAETGTGERGTAAALYERMGQARRAAGYRRENETVWRPLGKPSAGTAAVSHPDAAGLDRIFQRDARRYDGGFLWQ